MSSAFSTLKPLSSTIKCACQGQAGDEASGRRLTYLDNAVSFSDAPILGRNAVRVDLKHTRTGQHGVDTEDTYENKQQHFSKAV